MNDDAPITELELASAYLDDDVDKVQRAHVEASPELTALVASFRHVQAGLRDTPPVDAAARDTAVHAALAEFDVLRASPAATVAIAAASNVVPLQRRARFSRVVMSAAAALLIGGVGVVAVNSFGDSSNDQSSAEPAAAKELAADTSASGDAAEGAIPQTTPQTIGAINGAATAVPALAEPQDLLVFAAAPTEALITDTDSTSFAATDTTASGSQETVAIADAAPASESRGVAPSFVFDCPLDSTQVVVAEITWQGTPAMAVRDTVSGVIQAIDAQCTVLATVEP